MTEEKKRNIISGIERDIARAVNDVARLSGALLEHSPSSGTSQASWTVSGPASVAPGTMTRHRALGEAVREVSFHIATSRIREIDLEMKESIEKYQEYHRSPYSYTIDYIGKRPVFKPGDLFGLQASNQIIRCSFVSWTAGTSRIRYHHLSNHVAMRVELGRASASYATGSEYSLMARIVPLQFGALRGDEVVDYLRILKKLHDKHPSYVLAKRLHKKAMANGEKSPLIDELEGIFS